MTEPVILANGIQKTYRSGAIKTTVLHGVDLEVMRGECVFLVGPSGSGKTTLLSILGCILSADTGLLRIMDRDEIAGVLAHELAHVKNRDILIGSIAATLAGAVMMLANMARWAAIFGGMNSSDDDDGGAGVLGLLLMSILAPVAAMLIQMAISRSREYLADATGASFAGHPEGLARALEKLGAYSGRIPMEANPATAHMFIANPLSGRGLMHLFSTHPLMAERISRLRGLPPQTGGSKGGPDRMESQARDFWKRLSE